MSLLDRISRFAAVPSTHAFPVMRLMARDHEPELVVGAGELRAVSATRFEYRLTGIPDDPGYVLRQLSRQRQDRYDGLLRFRLFLEDTDGADYAGGWTVPRVEPGNDGWTFEGFTESIIGGGQESPTATGATEVRFSIPKEHHASLILARFVSTPQAGGPPLNRYALEVLGETVNFTFDFETGVLTISTPGSEAFPLTYTENWLGEPLRILFGQLAYPRLVARTRSEGDATLFVRPSPAWTRDSDWTALWLGERHETDKAAFWALYEKLLAHVASARVGGHRCFEANPITHFHEEVIQAARGSRWVWALTLASSIEGLVAMLYPRGAKRDDVDLEANTALIRHIRAWPGSHPLKETAIRAVQRSGDVTVAVAMRALIADGAITRDQTTAWQKIRNAVMHGNLVSPYSSQEDDETLIALADLMRALIRRIIGAPPTTGDVQALSRFQVGASGEPVRRS